MSALLARRAIINARYGDGEKTPACRGCRWALLSLLALATAAAAALAVPFFADVQEIMGTSTRARSKGIGSTGSWSA
jgi:hypothetical protein